MEGVPAPSTAVLSALRAHSSDGVVVYNTVGALLSLAQSVPAVHASLGADGGAGEDVRRALERHGGVVRLFGDEVAAAVRGWGLGGA